jgi:tRNA1Val (adenine37-N6)-methyltransferase
MKPFLFKQFAIYQDQTAMKVGTDGVLLGAWVKSNNAKHILDIGTGTGLIALMLAQRFSNSKIDALEIDQNAFKQAKANFKDSLWSSRLKAIHSSLQSFKSNHKYDLIVSNPPFFESLKHVNTSREQARQTASLSFNDLIIIANSLLNTNGELALIIPFEAKEKVVAIAKTQQLFPKAICAVFGTKTSKSKRILIQFSKTKTVCENSQLIIEISRHHYTDEYIALTKDFYLKM